VILTRDAKTCTGNFFIDDVVLAEAGVTSFDHYRVDPSKDLMPDFIVPADTPFPPGVSMHAIG
jgi:citronellol/citronellal dehydrogenase